MRRPWTYMLAGSIVAIGTAAHAGGLPASDDDSATSASSTSQTTSTATSNRCGKQHSNQHKRCNHQRQQRRGGNQH